MKLIIVILSVCLVLGRWKFEFCASFHDLTNYHRNEFIATGANAEESESISSEEIVPLESMIEPRGFLDDLSKCGLCETAMGYINKKITKDSSKVSQSDEIFFRFIRYHLNDLYFQEKIKKTLDKACTLIPIKSVRTKCHEKILKKGDKIAQKVADKADSKTVCKLLEMCDWK